MAEYPAGDPFPLMFSFNCNRILHLKWLRRKEMRKFCLSKFGNNNRTQLLTKWRGIWQREEDSVVFLIPSFTWWILWVVPANLQPLGSIRHTLRNYGSWRNHSATIFDGKIKAVLLTTGRASSLRAKIMWRGVGSSSWNLVMPDSRVWLLLYSGRNRVGLQTHQLRETISWNCFALSILYKGK